MELRLPRWAERRPRRFLIGGRKIAHAADGVSEHARFDEELADFFEEVVQMVGLEQVREAFLFEDRLGIAERRAAAPGRERVCAWGGRRPLRRPRARRHRLAPGL